MLVVIDKMLFAMVADKGGFNISDLEKSWRDISICLWNERKTKISHTLVRTYQKCFLYLDGWKQPGM